MLRVMPSDTGTIAEVMALLESRVGLCPEVLGRGTVERALRRLAGENGSSISAVSAQLLSGDAEGWNRLVEYVVVPETWFLRHPQAFTCLADHVRANYLATQRAITILSCPCATGEEAYSIAITLRELGMSGEKVRIDAMDISEFAIAAAKTAIFTPRSLREQGSEVILRYSDRRTGAFQIKADIRALVHFRQHNLMEGPTNDMAARYDVIFCRNLLIYLNERARQQLVETLRLSLIDKGIVFVGSAENDLISSPYFTKVPHAQAFAYLKHAKSTTLPVRKSHPKRRQPSKRPVAQQPHRNTPEVDAPAGLPSLQLVRQYADEGLLEESSRMCRVLLEQNPLDPAIHFLLGEIDEAAGNSQESEKHFERAIYFDPEHYQALIHLSLSRARQGDLAGSQRYRDRARRVAERSKHLQEHN
jgi:chemotaxis protein methyltransferase WspC